MASSARRAPRLKAAAEMSGMSEERGTIEYEGRGSLAVGDTVKIFYTPPKSFFKKDAQIICAGGYDGWSIENFDVPPIQMPVLESDGQLSVSINIPNFARSIQLFFSDGVKFDVNGGAMYQIPIHKIQALGDDGRIHSYLQEEDGRLTKVETPMSIPEIMKMVDERMSNVKAGDLLPDIALPQEERALMQSRSEATLLGEELGMGNIHINEARDLFDKYAKRPDGGYSETISRGSAAAIITEDMGFGVPREEVLAVLDGFAELRPAGDKTPAGDVTLIEFLRTYARLDGENVGVEMV